MTAAQWVGAALIVWCAVAAALCVAFARIGRALKKPAPRPRSEDLMLPTERRRALARGAVWPALKRLGWRLPQHVRDALADAVLAAVEPELEHCVHSRAVHGQHHDRPVTGCPWCTDPAIPNTVPTGGLL